MRLEPDSGRWMEVLVHETSMPAPIKSFQRILRVSKFVRLPSFAWQLRPGMNIGKVTDNKSYAPYGMKPKLKLQPINSFIIGIRALLHL